MQTLPKICLAIALLLPSSLLVITATAEAGGLGCLGCCVCPQCQHCCQLSVDRVDAEKTCWTIECEQICVPKFVFPWQKRDCCTGVAHNGAYVKNVKVLKKHKYTCPECEYTWTPRTSGCCGSCDRGHAHRTPCHHSACDLHGAAACCAAPMAIEMGPAVPAPVNDDDLYPPQPYDHPVDSIPSPSDAAPLPQPSASLLGTKKVQVVSFMRDLLER